MAGHSYKTLAPKPSPSSLGSIGAADRFRAPRRNHRGGQDGGIALHPSLLLRDVLAAASGGKAGAGLETWPVRGALLRDSLLGPGDSLLVQPGADLRPADLALVRLRGMAEPTLRRVHPEGGRLRLSPEDDRLPDEHCAAADVEILGRVLSVVRQARPESQVPLAI